MKNRYYIFKGGNVHHIDADQLEVLADSHVAVLWDSGKAVAAIKEYDYILKKEDPETPEPPSQASQSRRLSQFEVIEAFLKEYLSINLQYDPIPHEIEASLILNNKTFSSSGWITLPKPK